MSMIQKKRNNRRQTRKRNSLKDLTHEQIAEATAKFLSGGGVIRRIESTEKTLEEFLAASKGTGDADEFLNGGAS